MRWISVFEDVFWLGKPKFHNRRMNSAARISRGEVRNENYEFQFLWFFLTDVDIILPKEFCLSGRGF
jgi:hypothetical protein